ncbi:MAG: hypothetical protein F4Y40_10270 [Acidimicrobiia bacterium]|nr:hypothetical protein [Acidimicrobiia bacterium]
MKFLYDKNLGRELKDSAQDLFPGSLHVGDVGLLDAPDEDIWAHAKRCGFVIASTDKDYRELSRSNGHPPKVVWVRPWDGSRNRSMSELASIFQERYDDLLTFHENEQGVLCLP